jgi:type I restriction enzyme M protein
VTSHQLDAVITLPGGVFQPHSGARTAILVLTKAGKCDEVWFYEVAADGFALNARRNEDPEHNDLWDLVYQFHLRQPGRFWGQPPAFLPASSQESWRSALGMPASDRARHYAGPKFAEESRQTDKGERFKIKVLREISVTVDAPGGPKHWTAPVGEVAANKFDLNPARYKPSPAAPVTQRSPVEIIRELQTVETQIQSGLDKLLALVESK